MLFLLILPSQLIHATVIEKPPVRGSCSGHFTEPEGTLASMNFPDNHYPALANCTWTIKVDRGKRVRLDLLYMHLNDTQDCFNDYLSIYDAGYEIERFCGWPENEYAFLSTSNSVRLQFISDAKYEGDGFALAWREVPVPDNQFDCDFNKGICDQWTQDSQDDIDFTLRFDATSSPGTGPTSGYGDTGAYLYMEASAPALEGDEAQLIAPFVFMSPDETYCLRFWYHMHGEGVGALQVYITERGYRSKRKLVWSRIGQQKNAWMSAQIPIRVIYPNYAQVIFRAIRGISYTSDIAIDQVSLVHGSCSNEADNITPWKVYGQAIVESIRSMWLHGDDEEAKEASVTTAATIQTPTSVTPTSQTLARTWYCDKKLNVTFNPANEACCGGEVRKKHRWLRCCQSTSLAVPGFYSLQVKGCCGDFGIYYKRQEKCCQGYLVEPSICDMH